MSSLGDVMVVGLTGQTGAGKSTVSRVFVEGGFQLIDADQVCRKVQQKGSRCLADLLDFFPKEILQEDGELNRKVLGEIVFTDRSKLEMLNTICYPYIMGEILRQIRMYTAQGKKLILLDAPTLFESRADDFCDVIISVVSEESLRQQRIIARDHISRMLHCTACAPSCRKAFFEAILILSLTMTQHWKSSKLLHRKW